jgi:transcriptional regulator with XRE-family HTH domain
MTLKERRTRLGFTQIEVAIAIGVSMSAYQLWERGAMNPTPDNQEKLDKFFEEKERMK